MHELFLNIGFGTIGSGFYFLSWILQSYESRKKGKSIVTSKFWLMRVVATLFLIMHYVIRVDHVSFFLMVATLSLTMYNLVLCLKKN